MQCAEVRQHFSYNYTVYHPKLSLTKFIHSLYQYPLYIACDRWVSSGDSYDENVDLSLLSGFSCPCVVDDVVQ